MKKLILIIAILCGLSAAVNAQTQPAPLTGAEEQEAKNLAARFFNRFQETQDIAPLIEEFFVKDFSRRLKFCRTTGECGGENRDFWKEREDFVAFNATQDDFLRTYTFSINDMFLSVRLADHLKKLYPKKNWNEEIGAKAIAKEVESRLGKNRRLFKFGMLGNLDKDESDDFFISKFRNLSELHRFLTGYEKYLAELRLVETKLKNEFQMQKSDSRISFSETDFRVYSENNRYRFFDYPVETKMFQVWSESDSIRFVIDLIIEDDKLKIVAVYPPMD